MLGKREKMTENQSLQNLKCPNCSGPMVSRKNSKDGSKFWGCQNFPKCKGNRDSMGLSKREREAERNRETDWDGEGY